MSRKKELELALEKLAEPLSPRRDLEQYPTPAHIAADLLWEEELAGRGLSGRIVVDLGAGTGRLCIGAALLGAECVGLEIDERQIRVLLDNARIAGVSERVEVVLSDVRRPPLRPMDGSTAIMNPPFGTSRRGADREFLAAASTLSDRILSLHIYNESSLDFLSRFLRSRGFVVVKMKKYTMLLRQTMEHHVAKTVRFPVVLLVSDKMREVGVQREA